MYVVERQGTDVQDAKDRLPRWADKINIISQNVPIDLSSTKMRLFLKRGFSVKYFVPNAVRFALQTPSPCFCREASDGN